MDLYTSAPPICLHGILLIHLSTGITFLYWGSFMPIEGFPSPTEQEVRWALIDIKVEMSQFYLCHKYMQYI
jgi:hypothetical protein